MKIDFSQLLASSRLYTFHSHSQFCDGHAPLEQFVAEAVKQGFTHYGFSPHSPVPIESPCNMSHPDVSLYLDEAARLKSLYKGQINLYTGMEIDYLGPEWGPSHPYFSSLPLDFTIGSVHFIPTQEGEPVDIDGRFENFRRKMNEKFHNDIEYVVRTFYSRSMEMIEQGGFDILGHADKIGHNADHYNPGIESKSWYQHLLSDLIDAVAATNIVVEINTKARADHGRFFPSTEVWRRLVDARVPLIVNSDAHYPALINASRAEAFQLLDALSL